jgi:Recombinase zinc beta ribbon domain/TrwC relaxase
MAKRLANSPSATRSHDYDRELISRKRNGPELWARVEAQIQRLGGKRWSATSIGGQGRRRRGPKHLFNGFIICGVCGSRMTIVFGNGPRGYVKYDCPSHRNRGVCANSVMIRKDRLEDQLLGELSDRLLQPAMVDYALQSFHEQLQRRLQEIRDQADSAANGVLALQGKRQELKAKATNVTEAIAAIGHSPSLLAQLATIDTKADGFTTKAVQHRAGWYATFSAPKSVSLTALVGADERVREAHRSLHRLRRAGALHPRGDRRQQSRREYGEVHRCEVRARHRSPGGRLRRTAAPHACGHLKCD